MLLQHPFQIISPTVDGDALAVLAGADAEFTAPQVHALVGHYTVEGARRALQRLTSQGIVIVRRPTRAALYRLNRAHLGADAVVAIATIRQRLLAELRRRLEQWAPSAEFVALFGSAATGAMRDHSDIDVFIVRPSNVDADLLAWREQIEAMERDVTSWTGNDTRVLEYDTSEVREGRAHGDPVLHDILRDGIVLHGSASLLRRPRVKE